VGRWIERLGIFCLLSLNIGLSCGATDPQNDDPAPLVAGNFALPTSQQPGPFVSFGQNLIGRNKVQLELDNLSPYPGVGPFRNALASLTYGITDSTSFYFGYPLSATTKGSYYSFSQLGDLTFQLEQAIYAEGNLYHQDQVTIVGALTVPDKDFSQESYNAFTYFIGTTYNRTTPDWQVFASSGMLFSGSYKNSRLGSVVFYQGGIGHVVVAVPNESIVSALLELYGVYAEKDQITGNYFPDTGGNVVSLVPSLSLAEPWFIVRAGLGFPVVQSFYGNQQPSSFYIVSSISITID